MAWGLGWFKPSETAGTFLRRNAEFVPFPCRSSRPFRAVCRTGHSRMMQSRPSTGPTTRSSCHKTSIATSPTDCAESLLAIPQASSHICLGALANLGGETSFTRDAFQVQETGCTKRQIRIQTQRARAHTLARVVLLISNQPRHRSPRINYITGHTHATLPAIHEAACQSNC